ncbi:malate dehydrogenase [Methylophaga lonarensis MPL]|uniref:Malate dehydrogenase n=1 Tax=Methylophaga lonarensis MPL TaxID=1286106 RepID=M7P0I9_9GAMM|nr:NAD-dependent malic enzyme [Methylophaga lonarensis]EMR12991.1 malate dehydrogenase [Methylophaga lonarensis MPL]
MSKPEQTAQAALFVSSTGSDLLANSLLNKGTAFTAEEREAFKLKGLLPGRIESLQQQAARAYHQYNSFSEAINKHIYLRMLQDANETLFYYLLEQHLDEMMPVIYTPTVGEACEQFSEIYRRPRGLFISYPDRHRIKELLDNVDHQDIKVIVVTDGSRILGLGDQGAGGMGIPIGKLSLYTACAGIDPAVTLPVMLDVGTNNPQLLDNPLYIGWQHKRISDHDYDAFVDLFIEAAQTKWPDVLLQFEDFEQQKALPLLQRYRQQICCFNDDIQGTASVTVGTLLAACKVKGEQLRDQTLVFAGAGSAGCGIAEQIVTQMQAEGLTQAEARSRIYMVDRQGLLSSDMQGLFDFQQQLAQSADKLKHWPVDSTFISLADTIKFSAATVLIGVSGQPGLFDEAMVKQLHSQCQRPIIFPLSNPSSRVEAVPSDLLHWTQGQAIIATGSPFKPVKLNDQWIPIAQCNNSYIFPGIGLAVIAGNIHSITDEMLTQASEVLAEASPAGQSAGENPALLPALDDVFELSQTIAFSVIKVAQSQGLAAEMDDSQIHHAIKQHLWRPRYRPYQVAKQALDQVYAETFDNECKQQK